MTQVKVTQTNVINVRKTEDTGILAKINQTDVINVKKTDTLLLEPGSRPPYTLRQDTGVLANITDIFALSSPQSADVILFDPVLGKYKNIPLTGAMTVNTSGVGVLTSIDCGTF